MDKILYRYEIEYKSEDGDTSIQLREFPVVRETTKCYFIKLFPWDNKEKRVSKTAYSTYAYTNKEVARAQFISRTNTRIRWFEFWKSECEKALELVKKENI